MNNKIQVYISVFVFIGVASLGYMMFSTSQNKPLTELELHRQLKNTKKIPEIEWKTLYKYNYKSGKGPKELMEMDGKLVKIAGFFVPLTDNYSQLDEFLLVPDAQSCIHVPPPPPNLIISVKLRKALPMNAIYNPTWVIGIFKIEHTTSEHGGSSYKLDGVKLEKYEFENYY